MTAGQLEAELLAIKALDAGDDRPVCVRTGGLEAYIRPEAVLGVMPGMGQAMGMSMIVFRNGPGIGLPGSTTTIAEALWPGISPPADNPVGRIGPRGPGGGVILGTDGRAA